MQLSREHEELRESLIKFIDREINPYIEEWETARIFPAHAARIEQAMSGLTQAEQREVTALLRKLGLAAADLGPGEEEDDR